MSDLFLADESSVEDSQPRELVKIQQSKNVVYYLATGQRDIAWDGKTWVASPATRTSIGVDTISGQLAPTVTLPLAHPLCQRWMALGGYPPQEIVITLYRKQLRSGVVEAIWEGVVSSYAIVSGAGASSGVQSENHVGQFTVQSALGRNGARPAPFCAQRTCNNILYDRNCKIDPSGMSATGTPYPLTISTTLIGVCVGDMSRGFNVQINPSLIDLNNVLGFEDGDLQHVTTGEMATIRGIGGAVLTSDGNIYLATPLPDVRVGDAVVLRAGCDRSRETCVSIFGNIANFNGQPDLPTKNLWIPGLNLGVYQPTS